MYTGLKLNVTAEVVYPFLAEHNTPLKEPLQCESWRETSTLVYITGPGEDWEVIHPMLGHLTNINPISLKYWTLCLHMGPEWDYPVVNRPSDSPTKRNFLKVYFCCLVTLGFFSILMCEMCLSAVYSTVEYGAQPKHDKTLSLCVNLILILHLYCSLYFFFHSSIHFLNLFSFGPWGFRSRSQLL